ncbi:MAG: YraN family protein [Salinivirgaceae bacterium]|jgi:putative endonuclease|nr:YraN family protein [Salinivirgaceae bacterium]
MSQHNETGKEGEKAAVQHLQKKGYKIHATNWRYNHKEIDIVAQQNDEMVFVEVKTRATTAFELPQEAVTKQKMKNLVYAADAYLQEKEIDLESRFDIVSVLAQDEYKILEHIEDAFRANELL